MTRLKDKTCVPCKGGIPPLTPDEAKLLQKQTPDWELIENATRIQRRFRFRNFLQAQDFAVTVGNLSEEAFHHPDITYGWGYCSVLFYSHKIKGLHENDFIMAAKVDDAYKTAKKD
ncbi:MAG: 4a-hydroxytetrahydrobiopterin dehydratase [Gammaproteobacteria bacterium]|nr:MAG: 4a-hydroxytetrahydrobiopterin dehydratase [Gammaproteobacteria bacterium]